MKIVILAITAVPFLMAIINSATMRIVRVSDASEISDSVSILIPMRNEERNVDQILANLSNINSLSQHEIIVLDDQSTDTTSEVLAKQQSIQIIRGADLPDGWLGKNFACHQLVAHSKGDYLVFVDADVRLHPAAIAAAISDMKKFKWDFISPYPKQIAVTFYERLIQPLLQWSWISSVPLRFAEKSKFPSMVVANGQFFIVTRQAYLKSGGHKAIRHEVLDDLELARTLTKSGFNGGVADASRVALCRMYNNRTELFDGYSKSLWRAFGSPIGAVAIALWLIASGVLPLALALSGIRWGWIGYILIVSSRYISSLRTGSNPNTALLHPIAIFVLVYLIARSWKQRVKGQLSWRGRSVT